MSLTELLKNADVANITVAIGLKDLREWHEEILNGKLNQMEQAKAERSKEEFLSPAEVCKMLTVSRSTLTRWQNAGYLVPSKVGGKSKYRKAEIFAILNTKNR
jgi:hypothetical protein